MNKVLDFLKEHKYLMVALVLVGISITLGVTYSNYIVTSNDHKAAEMYIGELKYSIEIDGSTTNTLSVPTGETIIDVKVNNQNPVDTYYKLLYLKNSNLTVKYYETTKDTNDVTTTYSNPNGSVTSGNSNTIKLKITNSSTSSQNLGLSVKGGYITNTVDDITIPSTYSGITSVETPSTNTYFCTTTDTLTQGLKYVNGQYTYAYKQEGKYASSGLAWNNINNNSWGVQLTDKTSTDAVISKVCTYINNKPIISMSYMFYKSQATLIDLSDFNTSNVNNMSYMFSYSQATTLDLSNFDTSNVINMSSMFSYSQATSLDLSSFDTSKVTKMIAMFYYSQAVSLDLSNFDTSNVTSMHQMFSNSKATTINVSSFDTSNVTDMQYMFSVSQVTTIDVSNFNTSNVINMDSMFAGSQAVTLDLSTFNTKNVMYMGYMFMNSKAKTIKLDNFNTGNVIDMEFMFAGSQATTLDLSSFDTSNVTNMQAMFRHCQTNTALDLSNFNTSKVTTMSVMFSESKFTILNLSSFDTSKVTSMSNMFSESTNLKTIYTSEKFNTDNVTDEGIDMFDNCTNLVGGAGTTYNSRCTDKTYARIDYMDGVTYYPGYFTAGPSTFSTDDWTTIIDSVRAGNTRGYKAGETKEINLNGAPLTYTLRIANTSTPSECSTSGFSQTACGFVLEFADIITTHAMNDTATNVGGWPNTSMRTFVNKDIYNSLPSDLKNGIIDTTVVSSHGSSDSSNFTSTDKLYLLAAAEIYSDFSSSSDTSRDLTKQLDYYKNEGVTTSNYSKAIKMYNSKASSWWLRSAISSGDFYTVGSSVNWGLNYANYTIGVSPAFRIG